MFSIKFRRKVLSVQKKYKLTNSEVANRFDIGVASIIRWKRKLEPKLKRNKPPIKIKNEALKEDIKKYPDAYLYERAERLNVSKQGIAHALKRLRITYKKNSESPKSHRRRKAILSRRNTNA